MMWGFGGVFVILCMAFMVWMMFGHGMMHGHSDAGQKTADTPERILAERFAKGEIDVEEYDQRLRALGRPDRSAQR